MASIIDMLTSSLDGGAVAEIAKQLGKDEATTKNAINSALPMLLGALQKSTQRDQGAGLAAALQKRHDGSILGNVSGFLARNDRRDGAGILKHVLGSKQEQASAALQAAAGVNETQAAGLLQSLAPLVLGAVAKSGGGKQLQGGDLTQMLDSESQEIESRSPGVMGALSGILDADGDGDTDLGDLLKVGSGKLGRLFR